MYSRPYNKAYPVVCMDEKPIQFFADFRKGFRSKKNGVSYEDYQYIRNGTACIFLFTEPLSGWRYADAQERRIRQDWAKQIEWLLTEQYPDAEKVVLVMDNLNTHNVASLYATFPPQYARELAERLEIHEPLCWYYQYKGHLNEYRSYLIFAFHRKSFVLFRFLTID